jgi:hypothetical protein
MKGKKKKKKKKKVNLKKGETECQKHQKRQKVDSY